MGTCGRIPGSPHPTPPGHVAQEGRGLRPQTHGACPGPSMQHAGEAGCGPRGSPGEDDGPGRRGSVPRSGWLCALPAPTLGKPPGLRQPWERRGDQAQESTPPPALPLLRSPPGVLETPVTSARARVWAENVATQEAAGAGAGLTPLVAAGPAAPPARRCPRTPCAPLGRVTSHRPPTHLFSSSHLFWEVDSWISN